jgi:hypothetical protein
MKTRVQSICPSRLLKLLVAKEHVALARLIARCKSRRQLYKHVSRCLAVAKVGNVDAGNRVLNASAEPHNGKMGLFVVVKVTEILLE